jgi:hypothetical protein
MPECRPTSAAGPCACARASSLPTTRPSRARWRELVASRLRLQPQAFCRPGQQEPNWPSRWPRATSSAWPRCARRRIDSKNPVRLRHPDPRPAGAGPLHPATHADEPRPRLCRVPGRQRHLYGAVAREVVEFYGDKIAEHPVGTGPFRLASLAAQLRRSCSSATPATVSGCGRRRARRRRRRGPGHPAARCKGRRLPLVDRVVVRSSKSAAALAELPERAADRHRGRAAGVVPVAMPGGKLAPHLANKGVQGYRTRRPRPRSSPSSTWKTRWWAATPRQGGAAPRAEPGGTTSRARSRLAAAARPSRRSRHRCRTPRATTRSSAARTANTARPRRAPCWTCTAMSTATATAGASNPTASR